MHDGLGVSGERLDVIEGDVLVDDSLDAVARGDLRGAQDKEDIVSVVVEGDVSVESVEDGVVAALGADDLGDFDLEAVGAGVGDYHLGDGEGGFVDVGLGDVGVSDVDAAAMSIYTDE